MFFATIEDFYDKISVQKALSVEAVKKYAEQMKNGDADARQCIIDNYLHFVASFAMRHATGGKITLGLIYCCIEKLEKAVDSFDFEKSETNHDFVNYLSPYLRQAITNYIANS